MSGSDRGGPGFFLVFDTLDVLGGPGSSEHPCFFIYIRKAVLFHSRDGVCPHSDD